jgi:hypothetical protein
LADVGTGKWFFDYVADKIYFVDDPTGRQVETSVALRAFSSRANNVTVRSLIVEKYATPAQMAPIAPDSWQNPGGLNWVIEDNEVRWNHAVGIGAATGVRISRNFIHHNGATGIVGGGNSLIVENNEIAFNNYNVWFFWHWEAGGYKFVKSNGVTARNNYVHDNHGAGLWTDFDNINILTEGNRVENNEGPGIFHEISCDAVTRNNVVRNNRNWSNIFVSNSKNTEVYGNTVEGLGILGSMVDRSERTSPNCGDLVVENLWVHDNTITLIPLQGYSRMGLQQAVNDHSYFTSRNNRFDSNVYDVPDPAAAYWTWMDVVNTWSQWRGYGQDLSGSVR